MIAIVVVLASVVFMFARQGLAKAAASKSLARLRQSGSILLADAQEKNGKMQYAVDAEPVDSEFLPYNIVRKSLGIEISSQQTALGLCDIMHWDAAKLKPAIYPRNCFGVNFTDIPDVPAGFGVTWTDETVGTASGDVAVRTLISTTVNRPGFYPILLDSSNAQGEEIFRIREADGGYVGLRNSGKAHGFFLDGSARALDKGELKAAGFTRACDNSTTPPKMLRL